MQLKSLIIILFFLGSFKFSFSYDYKRVDSTNVKFNCRTIHLQEESVPWDIYVLEVDLTNKNNKLKTGLANDKIAWVDAAGNSFKNKETLGHMVARRINSGENVIGGINADFFNMTNGMQFNVTATNGEIASTGITSKNHAALYTDELGEPFIGKINLEQKVSLPGIGEHKINGINIIRNNNFLVIYNNFSGQNKSFANEWGLELLLEPLDSGLINGVRNYKILEKAVNVTASLPNQIILSGIGTAKTLLAQSSVGQSIQIYSSFPGLVNKKITELIGGWGHIIQHGENYSIKSIEEEGTMFHEYDRHPRSAAGYNKDKTKMYLVAVDGRTDLSKGMNLSELAEFMISELNIWEGLNFDGGGSTTLMAENETINNPSGGIHRAITNALLIINEENTTEEIEYSFKTTSTTSLQGNNKLYYEIDETNKSAVWIMETDLSKPDVHICPVLANQRVGWSDAFGIAHKSKQPLTEMIEEWKNNQDTTIIGGINASPFVSKSGEIPEIYIQDGIIASFINSEKSTPAIWFDQYNKPYIENFDVDIKIKAANGNEMVLNSVNKVRWLDNLVLYTSFIGEKTNTNQWGAEVLLQPESEVSVNGVIPCSVLKKESSAGKMPFEKGQFVLSGNTAAFTFIKDNIQVGEKIELITSVSGAGNIKIKHVVAGSHLLFKNGEEYEEIPETSNEKIVLGNDLRTAIGYNSDKSKLFFFVSEEYSTENKGLPLNGLKSLMKKYHIYDGICMDGGANSTMSADNEVVNTAPQNQINIANGLVVANYTTTGLQVLPIGNNIKLYPNPVSKYLTLDFIPSKSENIKFEIHNTKGQLITSKIISLVKGVKNQNKINLSEVIQGTYIYRIISENQEIKSGKVIIKRDH